MNSNSRKGVGRGQTPAAHKRAGKRKPAVAFRLADAALENIKTKLLLLRECLVGRGPFVDATGKIDYASVPSSVRRFNSWRYEDIENVGGDDLPRFSRNANDTLNKHPAELASIQSTLKAIVAKARAEGEERPNKERSLARVREESRLQKTLREIAERELKLSRQELIKLRTKIELLETQLKSQAVEARKQSDSMLQELEHLRAQNSALTKTVRTVYPLK